jgi:protein-S-isoprenylcysteine O-methyltransferase Ste14
MKDRLLKLTQHEYTPTQRLILLFFAGILFLVLIPITLVLASPLLDQALHLPRLVFQPVNGLLGLSFILAGLSLGFWSNYVQFTIGRGTPVPVMATQNLIVQPPYAYCRNPMALGAIALYLGIAIWLGSLSALGMVLLPAVCLLIYIKLLEEKEMQLRFGDDYLEYRRRTPFLIPRFRSSPVQHKEPNHET